MAEEKKIVEGEDLVLRFRGTFTPPPAPVVDTKKEGK